MLRLALSPTLQQFAGNAKLHPALERLVWTRVPAIFL